MEPLIHWYIWDIQHLLYQSCILGLVSMVIRVKIACYVLLLLVLGFRLCQSLIDWRMYCIILCRLYPDQWRFIFGFRRCLFRLFRLVRIWWNMLRIILSCPWLSIWKWNCLCLNIMKGHSSQNHKFHFLSAYFTLFSLIS